MRNKLTLAAVALLAGCGDSPPDRTAIVDTTLPKGVEPLMIADASMSVDAAADAAAAAMEAAANTVNMPTFDPMATDSYYEPYPYDSAADAAEDAAANAEAAAQAVDAAADAAAEYYDE